MRSPDMAPQDREDLLAYWRLIQTPNARRWNSIGPATMLDIRDMIALSRGKPPSGLVKPNPAASQALRGRLKREGALDSALDFWMD